MRRVLFVVSLCASLIGRAEAQDVWDFDADTPKKTEQSEAAPAPQSDVTSVENPSADQAEEQQGTPEFSRRFAGKETPKFPAYIYESIPPMESSAPDFMSIPDRWRMFYAGKWYDPYNQNVLKGDIPIFGGPGHEWFLVTSIISDTMTEMRRLPTPVGFASTNRPGSNDVFGNEDQFAFVQNVVTSFSLIRGNTSFKPPELEIRAAPVFNLNYLNVNEDGVVNVDPAMGDERTDGQISFQELFADVHLGNISERYDFISTRVGIQQFVSDFRGFIYNDNEPGVRLFGNYDNNKWQYNLAYFSRLEKDTNSGLNTMFNERDEDVWIANVFRQDAPVYGHTLSLSVLHREDHAGDDGNYYDSDGFLVRPASIGDERPKNVYSTYVGLTGDGHFDRINSTSAFYYVFGDETHNEIAQQQVDISAGMVAQEFSYDVDWMRFRASFFWASGDGDPQDGQAHGFDGIFDNPNFAGGDNSFWQRQGIPFIGGGAVNLVNRNSLLPDLKPGKEKGQANFVNPGLRLYNLGFDADVLPELKIITNASYLQFDRPETLQYLRQDGSINRNLGWDLSLGMLYRPFLNNNVQLRAGVALLLPGSGTENLFGDDLLYDVFTNMIFQY